MGGSSKQTIGYWYNWALGFGWCKGPVDAFLEFRAGDKTAWQGRLTSSGTISINKPNLWGGEDNTGGGTGGIVGDMDVMFGEATQAPNDYLISTFGPQQSGRRGKFCTVFRGGKFGAFVANPKPVSAKLERILDDWQDDTPWYPEKARIVVDPGTVFIDDLAFPATSAAVGSYAGVTIDSGFTAADILIVEKLPGMTYRAWSPWPSDDNPLALGKPWFNEFNVTNNTTGTITKYWPGVVRGGEGFYATIDEAEAAVLGKYILLSGGTSYTFWLEDTPVTDNRGGLSVKVYKNGLNAMNPAHILYDSLTHADLQGEPVGAISDASFRAAADKLYSEGFGLCTDYDSNQETPKQFQQRICNVIGASLSQSRVDGLYYLDLIRGDYDIDTLPIIGEDDILAFSQDPSVITETGNKLSLEWFDPQAKETRTTPPVYSMGNIRSAGRVIPAETKKYPEIPMESLALRVASRDLKSTAVPLNKFDLSTRATQRGLRPGMNARLQVPSEGIADMVVVIGSVAHGTATKGDMKIVSVQNVYSMPSTVYVKPQDGLWVPPDTTPTASPHQLAFEAPYVELASSFTNADLSAMPADAGYLLTIATRPTAGTSYAINTAAAGEDYAERGAGDWCPTATINEAADYLDTAFTLAAGELLDRVAVGSWALWDDEIVRVDAIDADAGTLTLGRGCADTVRQQHAAAARIYFCSDWVGTDRREYVDGDTVNAKLLSRLAAGTMALADATALPVVFVGRQALPYPPANVQIGGASRPASVSGDIVVTWATRNRLIQADQLVDATAASIAPEVDVRFALEFFDASDVLLVSKLDMDGATATVVLDTTGDVRMRMYAINDNGDSMQFHEEVFSYTPDPGTTDSSITAATWTPQQIIIDGGITGS
jgi:hypothetical protein